MATKPRRARPPSSTKKKNAAKVSPRKPSRPRAKGPKRKPRVTVVAALERELAAMRRISKEVADSAVAASALALAREIDKPKNSATSKAGCSRALSDVMDHLHAQLPPAEERDKLDDLSARRTKRRAAGRAAS